MSQPFLSEQEILDAMPKALRGKLTQEVGPYDVTIPDVYCKEFVANIANKVIEKISKYG